MTDLYFIRHGQSVLNVTKCFTGSIDSALTELGLMQANMAATFFDNIHLDAVYASDLQRAYVTGKVIADAKNVPIYGSKDLREIYAGLWEGVPYAELYDKFPDSYGVWKQDIGNAVCPCGETVAKLQERVNNAVLRIVKENPNGSVAIATHATPIRAMEVIWKNLPISEMKNLEWVSNASVTHVRYDGDHFCELVAKGYDKHLGTTKTELPAEV